MTSSLSISVVIPTRDRPEKLRSTLESVLAASKSRSVQIIVVDDNSSSLEHYKDPIFASVTIIHNESQVMLVKARNIGASNSIYKYIFFIDDDNLVSNNLFDEIVSIMEADDSLGIVGPEMQWSDGQAYLNYQRINLYTGLTKGYLASSESNIFESDGVPNVFAVRAEIFHRFNLRFDETYVQTFTEPEFASRVKRLGFRCVMTSQTSTRHLVENTSRISTRQIGGEYSQKAYYLFRNRVRYVSENANLLQFSLFVPCCFGTLLTYSCLAIINGERQLVKSYWRGFISGICYALKTK